jgi:hypothetical protein
MKNLNNFSRKLLLNMKTIEGVKLAIKIHNLILSLNRIIKIKSIYKIQEIRIQVINKLKNIKFKNIVFNLSIIKFFIFYIFFLKKIFK